MSHQILERVENAEHAAAIPTKDAGIPDSDNIKTATSGLGSSKSGGLTHSLTPNQSQLMFPSFPNSTYRVLGIVRGFSRC